MPHKHFLLLFLRKTRSRCENTAVNPPSDALIQFSGLGRQQPASLNPKPIETLWRCQRFKKKILVFGGLFSSCDNLVVRTQNYLNPSVNDSLPCRWEARKTCFTGLLKKKTRLGSLKRKSLSGSLQGKSSFIDAVQLNHISCIINCCFWLFLVFICAPPAELVYFSVFSADLNTFFSLWVKWKRFILGVGGA